MSNECEHDDPTVALFEFDKNRPQRLSFMGDMDANTGKQGEWCIRNLLGSDLEVAPSCDGHNPFKSVHMDEIYFQRVVQ